MRAALEIEKLVFGGDGLARQGSKAVFVPFVVPGESVDAEVTQAAGGLLRCADVRVKRKSEHRCDPPCPVFGQCGGCHYQHMTYRSECDWKREILRETLRRIGGIEWDAPIEVVTAEPFGYRNRTQLHVRRRGRRSQVGFHAARSHRLVPASQCSINSPKLNAVQGVLEGMARRRELPPSLRTIEVFTNEEGVQLNFPRRSGPLPAKFWARVSNRLGVSGPGAPLDYRCGEDVFRVSGRSFFQVNRHLVSRLSGLVLGDAAGGRALDLYAGAGLLTLPLARRFRHVVAVDSSPSAMRDLHANARRAGLAVRAVQMNVDAYLRGCTDRPDLIVADPPRGGLGARVVRRMANLAAGRMRLLSCDPATLARDIKGLAACGYSLEGLTLVDLFPQTYHVETVATLRLD